MKRLLLVLLLACTPAVPHKGAVAPPPPGDVAPGTVDSENIVLMRQKGLRPRFAWEPWSKEAFARARQQGRLLLLHGAAEWCHWCHVMEATTYLDPEVGALLRDRFVTLRVDIDSRPDIADRYAAWGWPATVIFSPEAEELGKFRGYLDKERMLALLREALKGQAAGGRAGTLTARITDRPAPPAALPWIGAQVLVALDGSYDEQEGGWGRPQKLPIGANIEVELLRDRHGDEGALRRAVFTLNQQRALIDPVWGGVYQYSTGGTWTAPHFEKLMPIQAAAIEACARGYAATRTPAFLDDAQRIARYLNEFLSNAAGGFLVSQDADVGAHDPRARFVDGHVYYRKDDAGRRALGLPRIDDHVYARENGLAIAALATLYEVSGDEAVLARAKQAADLLLRTHLDPDGGVRREAGSTSPVRFLIDAAALGRGLARLAEVAKMASYRAAALRIASAMLRHFTDERTGRLWVSTPDPAAAGVFARRTQPLSHNVAAARFLCALSRITQDPGHRRRAAQILAAIASPRAVAEEGRLIGEFLLALDEAGQMIW